MSNYQEYLALLERIGGKDAFTVSRTRGYAHFKYRLTAHTAEAKNMTAREAALLADGGNLCFGGRSFSKCGDGIFTGIVHTD